ncbi:thiamine pyrophosphate-binding protein [Heyndrickxia oleronia]|jgi:acetolactate synthase-1/2/3 large subunit|uniref:thiamine pyrophosphate-binding protein n=1 Tax=Heyndrickxia oleronia TaxID=38875 RepID=UPI000717529A|nr:thiamine pyrophosphate-binding protein [Heyndrickxia oleronia]MCI1591405.1 thiamine pyrophosphate-binding protein [Heyndrickxia oleronia]MCI1613867.1 thiamine pyrophosphate-binding protein [Heyndrickxia oleronia]MCI1744997.1 thiamine pyrophosphate-binding protein [Heyndrickxia oleronia]MCI1761787.1 thiamine pyrophosphate-binding protein [Heyndrickxia oleronia]
MPLTIKKKVMGAAQAIIECMKIEEITKVFCVPGESYLPVLDAIYDEPTIDLISTRHEGGASFMAEGFAKATRKPGVVMATRGVGGANLAIGVHTAYQDSTPMVVFLGQVHSKFRGREGFQEVDLDQFFGHIAKWTVEINDAERIPELVQRAFRIAQTGRPGPVVVSLPEDILKENCEMAFGSKVNVPKPVPAKTELAQIEHILNNARKPLIIAGGGIIHSKGEQELIDFAEKYYLPVAAAFRRHDVFPNNHPLYVGHLGLGTAKGILQTVNEADVILAIGTRLSEVTTQDYTLLSSEQTLIHIDISADMLGNVYPPEVGIVADAKNALFAFQGIQVQPTWQKWVDQCHQVYIETTLIMNNGKSEKLTNFDVIQLLQENLPENAIITNDAGNFAGWLHSYYQFHRKGTYIGPTSGAMGYGLPAAIGVKLAHPDRTVVSLSGDGGMMMTVQELETASRYNIPVISLVFNNRMYGTIRMHQEIHYPTKVSGTDLGDIDFSGLAQSLNANGVKARTKEEFKKALREAMHSSKPTVIEIEMDRAQISTTKTIKDIRENL